MECYDEMPANQEEIFWEEKEKLLEMYSESRAYSSNFNKDYDDNKKKDSMEIIKPSRYVDMIFYYGEYYDDNSTVKKYQKVLNGSSIYKKKAFKSINRIHIFLHSEKNNEEKYVESINAYHNNKEREKLYKSYNWINEYNALEIKGLEYESFDSPIFLQIYLRNVTKNNLSLYNFIIV